MGVIKFFKARAVIGMSGLVLAALVASSQPALASTHYSGSVEI